MGQIMEYSLTKVVFRLEEGDKVYIKSGYDDFRKLYYLKEGVVKEGLALCKHEYYDVEFPDRNTVLHNCPSYSLDIYCYHRDFLEKIRERIG